MNCGGADQVVISNKISGTFRSANGCAPNVPAVRDGHQRAVSPSSSEAPFHYVPLRAQGDYFAVADFAALDTREFVEAAYRVLLMRPSDPVGLQLHTRMLAQGASKAEVLAALRYSDEGMLAGVRIDGIPSWLVFSRFYPVKSRICRFLKWSTGK